MISRERVLKSLHHQEPDRVPIDFGGLHSSLHYRAHRNLLNYLGFHDGEDKIQDIMQNVVYPDQRLRKMFGADVISLYANPPSNWQLKIEELSNARTYINEWGIRCVMPLDGFFYDLDNKPVLGDTIEDIEKYPWPNPRDPSRVACLSDFYKIIHDNTDKALVVHGPTAGLFEHCAWMRGIEQYFLDMAINPAFVEAFTEKFLHWTIEWWDNVLDQVGQYVQIVMIGDDLGGQLGPLFSPHFYRKVYKPRHRQLVDFLKSKTDAQIFLHSCGSIYEFIPDIIEIGIQIINPVQLSASNMDGKTLKKEFGKAITFWGVGVDTQTMLLGSEEEVRDVTRRTIDIFAPDGGFVFASMHNIQANVPPENIVTMYETALNHGLYK